MNFNGEWPFGPIPETFDALDYLRQKFLWREEMDEREAMIQELTEACGRAYPWSYAYLANVANGRQKLSGRLRNALYRHSQGFGRPPNAFKKSTLGNI
jgi:hypothetical protein